MTGGIGSGKTAVARLLVERGARMVDADRVAHEVVAPGTSGFDAVVARFGPDVVTADGQLNRAWLAARVFDNDQARADLEDIIHPRVTDRILRCLTELDDEEAGHGGELVAVLDVPLLVEAGMHHWCDRVVVVTAPEQTRFERLVRDRNMAPDQVRARMTAQAGDQRRLAVATDVIDNSSGFEELDRQVDTLWETVRADANPPDGQRIRDRREAG